MTRITGEAAQTRAWRYAARLGRGEVEASGTAADALARALAALA